MDSQTIPTSATDSHTYRVDPDHSLLRASLTAGKFLLTLPNQLVAAAALAMDETARAPDAMLLDCAISHADDLLGLIFTAAATLELGCRLRSKAAHPALAADDIPAIRAWREDPATQAGVDAYIAARKATLTAEAEKAAATVH